MTGGAEKQPKNGSADSKNKKKKAKREKPPGTSVVDENTEPNDVVEALLREFMYRKGLGHILESFDESRPRGDKTINSVKAIYKALNLEEIYARMREADKGVSVFEVLVAHSFKKPEEKVAGAAEAVTGSDGRDDAASNAKLEQLEEKVRELEESLHDAREDGERATKELADLRRKFEAQKKELQQLRTEGEKNGDSDTEGEALSTPQRSRFGLTALPTLAGQKKDPLADGGVVVGKGVLKVNTDKGKTPPGQKKAVKFVDNAEWLKVEDVRKAASASSATKQPVLSVVYYRDADPTTLLSPVPFAGSYYHKLETGELDKGSEEVEEAIAQGRDGDTVIKLDSSEVSKYYIGRIVDSINESGIAVVVDIISDSGDGRGRGAIFIAPLSVAGRHRCRPPPPEFDPPPATQQQQQQQLSKLCKFNCGFFGSPELDGACSKCHEAAKNGSSDVKSNLFGSSDTDKKNSDEGNDSGSGDDYSDEDFDDPDYDFSDF